MICNSTGDYWLGLSSKSRSRRVMTFVECMLLPPECDYCTVLSASLSGLVGRRMSQAGWLAVARVVSSSTVHSVDTQYSSGPSSTISIQDFNVYMTRCRHGTSTSQSSPVVRAQELEPSPCRLDTSDCTMTGAAWSLFRCP